MRTVQHYAKYVAKVRHVLKRVGSGFDEHRDHFQLLGISRKSFLNCEKQYCHILAAGYVQIGNRRKLLHFGKVAVLDCLGEYKL